MSKDKHIFKALCPKCGKPVYGEDDWTEGKLCIQGECKSCGHWILEDEVDWEEMC